MKTWRLMHQFSCESEDATWMRGREFFDEDEAIETIERLLMEGGHRWRLMEVTWVDITPQKRG
jgi:hypothetical protein